MKKLILMFIMVLFVAMPASADVQATLEWSPNSETDLAGYNIYRSEIDGGPYLLIVSIPEGTETFTDTTLLFEKTYYWVLTAFDTEIPSNESGYSNQVSFLTPVNPSNGSPGSPGSVNVTIKIIVEIPQ